MDLMAARAAIFGGKTFEDYVARCPELSLLDQGLLDEPSAPILLVNGRHDLQNATDDIYLALEHGDPKTARDLPGRAHGGRPDRAHDRRLARRAPRLTERSRLRRRPCCARRRTAGTRP